ncbi:UNVERIFIED_CONTAM: hypothetical protein Slati_2456100 [Sesamum latifolium]|uniref:Reverse transcriptase domain-containing protein n=1 Tax=Sesamum latifolium TaxID=2727402 RepID=A0AAW2WES3_9LAMI
MDKIISPPQNAFVLGRRISNNILLGQELFHGYKHQNLPPQCALKVDLRKAYDTLEWDFILAMLRVFGFPDKLIMWIEECISTTSFSVSLNGDLHGFFPGARGLRQGDPMSPTSSSLLWSCCTYYYFSVLSNRIHFSFIGDALLEFADLSGLHANVNKSQLIPVRQQLLTILGFQEGVLPVRYLGLPLISSHLAVDDCKPLLLKVDERLQGWSSLRLAFAARVQLLKSMISALNVYWAMAFIFPKGVLKTIEARMRKFLWQGGSDSGVAKVGWSDVCKPGDSFFVWHDPRHPLGPLIHRFPRGPSTIGIPLEAKLSEVIDDDGWSWPLVTTNIGHMEITELSPPLGNLDTVTWNSVGRGFTTTDSYRLFQPPGPKVNWYFYSLDPFASLVIASSCGLRFWRDYLLWIELGGLDRITLVFYVLEERWRRMSTCYFWCENSRACLRVLKEKVRFQVPLIGWKHTIIWASRRWRGRHPWNASSRALLASVVYHVWMERNKRRFGN